MATTKRTHTLEVEVQILRITRNRFMKLHEIAEALKMPPNTVRAKYLYPMANEGKLKRQFPYRTSSQGYKAAT